MAILVEQTLNEIQSAGGINTNKPAVFGGLVTFTGGRVNNFVSNTTSTTITAAQSGTTFLFNQTTGITYTLPAPVVGLSYTFRFLTAPSSGSDKIITNAGTVFLTGSLVNIDTDTSNAVAAWTADGSTILAATFNGTTTGGIQGTYMEAVCISTTEWLVSGMDLGSGTVATPFATS